MASVLCCVAFPEITALSLGFEPRLRCGGSAGCSTARPRTSILIELDGVVGLTVSLLLLGGVAVLRSWVRILPGPQSISVEITLIVFRKKLSNAFVASVLCCVAFPRDYSAVTGIRTWTRVW